MYFQAVVSPLFDGLLNGDGDDPFLIPQLHIALWWRSAFFSCRRLGGLLPRILEEHGAQAHLWHICVDSEEVLKFEVPQEQ